MKKNEVIYQTKSHFMVFVLPGGMFIFSLIFFSWSGIWFSLAMFGLTGLLGLKALAQFVGNRYLITESKILVQRRFFYQRLEEIFLNRVEGVDVLQSFCGRLLNYGTIIIVGVGGRRVEFSYITAPGKFKRILEDMIAAKK